MEAKCFRYGGYTKGMVVSRLRLREDNVVVRLMEAGCFRYKFLIEAVFAELDCLSGWLPHTYIISIENSRKTVTLSEDGSAVEVERV